MIDEKKLIEWLKTMIENGEHRKKFFYEEGSFDYLAFENCRLEAYKKVLEYVEGEADV